MIKNILDRCKKLRNTVSTFVKWESRNAKEKATITLMSAAFAIIAFFFMLCAAPTLTISAVVLVLLSAVVFMFWKILEEEFK